MNEMISKIEVLLFIFSTFFLSVVCFEVGFKIDKFFKKKPPYASIKKLDENITLISSSSLALLALLLGFSFSAAMDNFEQNRRSVIEEASKINAA